MRRLLPFALLAALLAGCGKTVPGGERKITTPTPVTVIGKLPVETGPVGNPARGKAIFLTTGCGACHLFTPAGTTGKVGPNLDNLPALAKIADQGTLAQFVKTSIVDPAAYIAPGFPNAMPPNYGKTLSDQQIADLVAFLVQGSA